MAFWDLFSDNNEKKAARAQKAGLQAGRDAAYSQLDQGLAGYNQYANQAQGYYAPYANIAGSGASTYADALGLNGAEGTARAQGAFSTSPGYDFLQDEAARGVERSASAAGQLGSGNLFTALQDRATGLASQEYNGWLDRLGNLYTQGVGIAGNQAGIATGQGTAAYNTGTNKAQIGWSAETGMGNAEAEYQKSKDQSGLNIFNAVTGLLSLPTGGTVAGKFF